MAGLIVVIIDEQTTLKLTTPKESGAINKTCVYITLKNGKLVFTGGASIIERIEGEGMKEKIKE